MYVIPIIVYYLKTMSIQIIYDNQDSMTIDEFRAELKAFLTDSGMSKNALALKAGVAQSQVSDWSNGKGARYTVNARKVMMAIENHRMQGGTSIPEEIETAVRQAWGNNPHRKDLICDVLRALSRHQG